MYSFFQNPIFIIIAFTILILITTFLVFTLGKMNKKIKAKKSELHQLNSQFEDINNEITEKNIKLENDKKLIEIIKNKMDNVENDNTEK